MSEPPNEYEEVAILRGEDGVAARITKRRSNRGHDQFSFAFFREYPKDGDTKQTYWFSPRHIDQLAALIPDVEQRLRKEASL
jgi:hypothetical protein